jgi:hypothetical protein
MRQRNWFPFALLAEATAPAANRPRSFRPPVFRYGRSGQADRSAGRAHRAERGWNGDLDQDDGGAGETKANAKQQAVNYIIDATAVESPLPRCAPQMAVAARDLHRPRARRGERRLKAWRTLVSGASLVYLAQGQAALQLDRIQLPPTKAKYYRITFGRTRRCWQAGDGSAGAAPEPKRQSCTRRRRRRQAGEIEFDLGVRAPVDRIRIDRQADQRAGAGAHRIAFDARAEWRPVAATIAYRIVRDGTEIASPEVPVAPNPSRDWRVVVDAASGGLGMPPPELEVSWPARNLVFVARGAGPYTLAFGKKESTRAAMPLATLIPGYREQGENGLPVAAIGELRTAPPPAPSVLPAFIADQEPQRIGLWAALIAGVLLLAAMAWRLSRQMQKGAGSAAPASDADITK